MRRAGRIICGRGSGLGYRSVGMGSGVRLKGYDYVF